MSDGDGFYVFFAWLALVGGIVTILGTSQDAEYSSGEEVAGSMIGGIVAALLGGGMLLLRKSFKDQGY